MTVLGLLLLTASAAGAPRVSKAGSRQTPGYHVVLGWPILLDGEVLSLADAWERGVTGNDPGHFNRPTAVAVSTDGSFYVSDGYRNTRVIRFAADGRFLFQWGTKGSGPGQFDLPHGVALDAAGNVYVADRESGRAQIFDSAGRYLRQWSDEQLGRPYAAALDRRGCRGIRLSR